MIETVSTIAITAVGPLLNSRMSAPNYRIGLSTDHRGCDRAGAAATKPADSGAAPTSVLHH